MFYSWNVSLPLNIARWHYSAENRHGNWMRNSKQCLPMMLFIGYVWRICRLRITQCVLCCKDRRLVLLFVVWYFIVFRFVKNNFYSIQFDSRQKIDSIRYFGLCSPTLQQCTHSRIWQTLDTSSSLQQVVVESNCPILFGSIGFKESIRIANRNAVLIFVAISDRVNCVQQPIV